MPDFKVGIRETAISPPLLHGGVVVVPGSVVSAVAMEGKRSAVGVSGLLERPFHRPCLPRRDLRRCPDHRPPTPTGSARGSSTMRRGPTPRCSRGHVYRRGVIVRSIGRLSGTRGSASCSLSPAALQPAPAACPLSSGRLNPKLQSVCAGDEIRIQGLISR